MTFRPPLVLRILSWGVAIGGLGFLVVGIIILTGDGPVGRMTESDEWLFAGSGAVLAAVGVFMVLKCSVSVRLGTSSLTFTKNLVGGGSMDYSDIESVKLHEGPAQSVTIRDSRGQSFAINAYSVDWEPLIRWAAEHDRDELVQELDR